MRRVLSILAVAGLMAANIGAAPVLDHQQQAQKERLRPTPRSLAATRQDGSLRPQPGRKFRLSLIR